METAIVWVAIGFVALCLVLVARHDWVRLRGIGRTVDAEVVGHREQFLDNARSFAAIYAFDAEGARHEVVDQVYGGRPHPAVGTRVTLRYPFGRPDLARVPRPLLWLAVYLLLGFLLAVLIMKAFGLAS